MTGLSPLKPRFRSTLPITKTWVPHPCVFCQGGLRCCRYDNARRALPTARLKPRPFQAEAKKENSLRDAFVESTLAQETRKDGAPTAWLGQW
jgi:hypothetical protein